MGGVGVQGNSGNRQAVIIHDAPILATLFPDPKRGPKHSVPRVYGFLCLAASTSGTAGICRVQSRDVCRALSLSATTVARALRRLEALHLVTLARDKQGRGSRLRVLVRALYGLWKRLGNALQNVATFFFASYPQERSHPAHTTTTPEVRPINPKDDARARALQTGLMSPGGAVGTIRRAVETLGTPQAPRLRGIVDAVGRLVFHGSPEHRALARDRAAVQFLAAAIRERRLLDPPPDSAGRRRVAGWAMLFTLGRLLAGKAAKQRPPEAPPQAEPRQDPPPHGARLRRVDPDAIRACLQRTPEQTDELRRQVRAKMAAAGWPQPQQDWR